MGVYKMWPRISSGKRRRTGEQSSLATLSTSTAPNQELALDPSPADHRPTYFQNLPSGSGMVAGFWLWILERFHERKKKNDCAVWHLSAPKISTQTPHTQLENGEVCLLYLQLEFFCLRLSLIACRPIRLLINILSHCKQKRLQL